MAEEREGAAAPDPRRQRPHHIANIAHHFLGEEMALGDESATVPCGVVMCGPQEGALTARVCARLATHLPDDRVVLVEARPLPWSARSHLSADSWEALGGEKASDLHKRFPAADFHIWQPTSPDAPVVEPGARMAGAASAALLLQHLGTLNNDQLTRLEAALTTAIPSRFPPGGCDLLVWGLPAGQALELGAAYTLGRVHQLMRPKQVEVLLLDEAEGSPPAAPAARKDSPPGTLTARCATRFSRVCPGANLEVTRLSTREDGPADRRKWDELGRRIGQAAAHLSD